MLSALDGMVTLTKDDFIKKADLSYDKGFSNAENESTDAIAKLTKQVAKWTKKYGEKNDLLLSAQSEITTLQDSKQKYKDKSNAQSAKMQEIRESLKIAEDGDINAYVLGMKEDYLWGLQQLICCQKSSKQKDELYATGCIKDTADEVISQSAAVDDSDTAGSSSKPPCTPKIPIKTNKKKHTTSTGQLEEVV